MNLEQQVVSLEYAKRLKELGVEQKSLFYWTKAFYPDGVHLDWGVQSKEQNDLEVYEYSAQKIEDVENCSAFTVAELGEMFDRELKIHSGKTVNGLELYYCSFMESSSEECWNKTHCFDGDTEANVRAKMLVYLIENDLYDPKTQKTQTTV